MKILVFEYITGGGFSKSELPESLANEGLLMLKALLDDLVELASVEVIVMLDARLHDKLMVAKTSKIDLVDPEQNYWQIFQHHLKHCDAVWPIAPETDGILATLTATIAQAGKILLTSSAHAVNIAGNKWLTYQCLSRHAINIVPTLMLQDFSFSEGEWIIKPIDGVGCESSFVVDSKEDFNTQTAQLNCSRFIVQPHLQGKKTSLSCLFKQDKGWLLCVNQQNFKFHDKSYQLTDIIVNIYHDNMRYSAIVDAVAKAIPGLWGYVGIDLIETDEQIFVLEINPRLTTSFAGIKEACDRNCAELVLQLLDGEPIIQAQKQQPTTITINH